MLRKSWRESKGRGTTDDRKFIVLFWRTVRIFYAGLRREREIGFSGGLADPWPVVCELDGMEGGLGRLKERTERRHEL